jgi:cytochrome c-type biogenesis protein
MSVADHAQQVVTAGNLLLAMPVAAAAGFISFASPCVLPLVPGYLSYVSGVSGQDVEHGGRQVGRVIAGVALFVLGFSLVFMALGATLGALTSWLLTNRGLITRVAGVVVIVMGLVLAGVVRPAFLYRERRLRADKVPGGLAGALPLGMVFGLGWTPCIGPTLGAVLGLAAVGGGGVRRGAILLFAYSLGLGVPFLIAALGFRGAVGRFPALRRRFRLFELAGGGMLVVIGLLLVTGLWDSLLNQLRVWAGSVNLPL